MKLKRILKESILREQGGTKVYIVSSINRAGGFSQIVGVFWDQQKAIAFKKEQNKIYRAAADHTVKEWEVQ